MQSAKLLSIARNIRMRNKPLFDSLMDFEKTKKIRTKIRLNFTIDKSVASHFKKFCKDKGYNMSAKIEEAMRKMARNQ